MFSKKIGRISIVGISLGLVIVLLSQGASAATLTTIYDRLSTLKADTATGVEHYVVFTPTTTLSSGTNSILVLQFPDGDDGKWCRTAGSLTVTTITEDSASGLPGTLTGSCAAGSGSSSYDTIYICAAGTNGWTGGTKYGAKVVGSSGVLGTKQAAGNDIKVTVTSGKAASCGVAPTGGDTGAFALSTITTDQVGVSATVDPLFSFSISDTAIGFGTFSNTTKRYATSDENGNTSEPSSGNPTQISITTNAPNGAVVSAKSTGSGAAAGLYKSIAPTKLIAAAASTAVASASEGYGLYVKNAGSYTIDEGFDNDSASDLAISTAFQTIATLSAAASAATADVALVAAINGTTPAGSYADTLTLVGTGKF